MGALPTISRRKAVSDLELEPPVGDSIQISMGALPTISRRKAVSDLNLSPGRGFYSNLHGGTPIHKPPKGGK